MKALNCNPEPSLQEPYSSPRYINSCIFAYEMTMKSSKLMETLRGYYGEGPHGPGRTIDLICILNECTFIKLQRNDTKQWEYFLIPTKEDSLMVSLAILKESVYPPGQFFKKYYMPLLQQIIAERDKEISQNKL